MPRPYSKTSSTIPAPVLPCGLGRWAQTLKSETASLLYRLKWMLRCRDTGTALSPPGEVCACALFLGGVLRGRPGIALASPQTSAVLMAVFLLASTPAHTPVSSLPGTRLVYSKAEFLLFLLWDPQGQCGCNPPPLSP